MSIILSCICTQEITSKFLLIDLNAAGTAWNKLPIQVREVYSTAAFRAAYMKWYVNRT